MTPKTAKIWQVLEDVKDPEIPVVSVVEMGIVRDVQLMDDEVTVIMTPTFSGCPALEVMNAGISARIKQLGYDNVTINITLHPPWSSDWITPAARAKLKKFGLAPPPQHNGLIQNVLLDPVPCPQCDSFNTSLKNSFGSTLCRAIYVCNNCQEPFEQFKPL